MKSLTWRLRSSYVAISLMTSQKSSGKISAEFYAILAPVQIPLKIVRSTAFSMNKPSTGIIAVLSLVALSQRHGASPTAPPGQEPPRRAIVGAYDSAHLNGV